MPTRVCSTSDISVGQAVRVEVDGVAIALVQDSAGDYHALGDLCTHGDISLSEGFVEEDGLECWAHGSKFSLTTGQPQNLPAYEPVPVYTVTVEGEDILVDAAVNIAAGDNAAAQKQ